MVSLDLGRPNYEPQRGFVVRCAFYANGRHYQNGDRFDPRDAECDERRLRQLWEARYVDCLPAESKKDEALSDIEASAHE